MDVHFHLDSAFSFGSWLLLSPVCHVDLPHRFAFLFRGAMPQPCRCALDGIGGRAGSGEYVPLADGWYTCCRTCRWVRLVRLLEMPRYVHVSPCTHWKFDFPLLTEGEKAMYRSLRHQGFIRRHLVCRIQTYHSETREIADTLVELAKQDVNIIPRNR